MGTDELREFSADFHEGIRVEASASDALREEVFVEKMGEILEEYGEIEALVPSFYRATGIKVAGYCYDDEFKDFILLTSLFLDETEPAKVRVTNSNIETEMKRVTSFFQKCTKGLYKKIEISNEAYDLAKLIYECRKEIRNIKFVLITDGTAPRRPSENEELDGIEVSRTVWDLERTCYFYRTGEREQISVDFTEYCEGPLSCAAKDDSEGVYTTYLAFLPGKVLADMYSTWGIKMLDMNVRVFLSARGNVNKGISRTIRDEPDMFCAYNNGITVFAREVSLTPDGTGLLSARDFQIVNGGQTTASLYHTRKKYKAELDSINVQMKLTVIHDEEMISDLVPLISQYSNTQNKVQTADLAANESPHPEIQAVSKSILAPDPTGGSQQTHWFYERARGSYEEFRNLTAKTSVQKKHFENLNPKSQKFDKIKFAKVWNSYLRLPFTVSLGAQKNFARFNEWLREQTEDDWVPFFRKTIALLILWNEMARMVRRNKFQGYHHNIVAYTLAWFFQLTESRIDLDKIWMNQNASDSIFNTLDSMSSIVNEHIRDTGLNVTEYCKKKDCWEKLLEKPVSLPDLLINEYITSGKRNSYSSEVSSEKEAIQFCEDKGSQAWYELSAWLKERDFLTAKARSQCYNMGKFLKKGKKPSVALSKPCMKAWADAEIRGWQGE